MIDFIKSLKARIMTSKNTTIGGGVVGIAFAALIGKLEEVSGCKFQEAFVGIDWMQIAGFVFSQVFGALMTDSTKTIEPTTKTT